MRSPLSAYKRLPLDRGGLERLREWCHRNHVCVLRPLSCLYADRVASRESGTRAHHRQRRSMPRTSSTTVPGSLKEPATGLGQVAR